MKVILNLNKKATERVLFMMGQFGNKLNQEQVINSMLENYGKV